MEPLLPYLIPRTNEHEVYMANKRIYITTTDNNAKSFMIKLGHVKPFLIKYADLLSDYLKTCSFHFNVILTALPRHMLCIDVDYKDQHAHHDHHSHSIHLYRDLVLEIQNEMIGVQCPDVFDAYFLTREGSLNYHLIFPYLYMNRVDYVHLLTRLRVKYPQIKFVTGWKLYSSSKRMVQQRPYQVMGKLVYDQPGMMIKEPYLSTSVKAKYPTLPFHVIYTFLFFPGNASWFKEATIIRYPISLSSYVIQDDYLFSYTDARNNIYYLTTTLRSMLNPANEWTNDLYTWVKMYQDQYTIAPRNNIVIAYLQRFYPQANQYHSEDDDRLPGTTLETDV